MGTALHLLLSHWHNKRNAVRITKPETSREKGGKHRDIEGNKTKEKETEGQRDTRETVVVNTHFTIHFYSFSPPFSCLKVKFSQPETCHLQLPSCTAQTIRRQGIMVASSTVMWEREGVRNDKIRSNSWSHWFTQAQYIKWENDESFYFNGDIFLNN